MITQAEITSAGDDPFRPILFFKDWLMQIKKEYELATGSPEQVVEIIGDIRGWLDRDRSSSKQWEMRKIVYQGRQYYIPIDKERIKKANNDLRLKRKNPINNRNTLENCMRLKYT